MIQGIQERGMVFTGDSVCGILDKRKTMTRRILTRVNGIGKVSEFGRSDTQGYDWHFRDRRDLWNDLRHDGLMDRCPYKPGDRLYVRESFRVRLRSSRSYVGVQYKADNIASPMLTIPQSHWDKPTSNYSTKFHSGRFMPRWASRIMLEVLTVRVQRVQDISSYDAQAEGVSKVHVDDLGQTWRTYRRGFQTLWDSINLKRGFGWDVNPWVWAIEFGRIKP